MSTVTVGGRTFGRPVVVATHPRSGTHLTIDFLRRHFPACERDRWWWEPLNHLFLALDRLHPGHPHTMPPRQTLTILERAERPVVKTHSRASLHNFEDTTVGPFARDVVDAGDIYIVRDGRDVLCSAHRWAQAKGVEELSIHDYLRLEDEQGRSSVQWWAEHVQSWVERATCVVRFEDILGSPEHILQVFGDALPGSMR